VAAAALQCFFPQCSVKTIACLFPINLKGSVQTMFFPLADQSKYKEQEQEQGCNDDDEE